MSSPMPACVVTLAFRTSPVASATISTEWTREKIIAHLKDVFVIIPSIQKTAVRGSNRPDAPVLYLLENEELHFWSKDLLWYSIADAKKPSDLMLPPTGLVLP